MEMTLLGAMIGRQPLPCVSLTSSHNCSAFHFLRQPGVVAHRRTYPRVEATARHGARKENAKVRNRRQQKKFNGTPTKPRLSVFCSNRQLYAMLVDDQGKRILFYASTLQEAICGDPPCSTVVNPKPPSPTLVRHPGGLSKGRGSARQGVQGAGHLRGLVLRPQRLRSRGEDDGVRGSGRAARVPAQIAEAWRFSE